MPRTVLVLKSSNINGRALTSFLTGTVIYNGNGTPYYSYNGYRLTSDGGRPSVAMVTPRRSQGGVITRRIGGLHGRTFVGPRGSRGEIFLVSGTSALGAISRGGLLGVLRRPPRTIVFVLVTRGGTTFLSAIVSEYIILGLSTPRCLGTFRCLGNGAGCASSRVGSTLRASRGGVNHTVTILGNGSDDGFSVTTRRFVGSLLGGSRCGVLLGIGTFSGGHVSTSVFLGTLGGTVFGHVGSSARDRFTGPLVTFCGRFFRCRRTLLAGVGLGLFCDGVIYSTVRVI